MGENLALFSRFYYRPSHAASDALDNGSVAFAIGLAVLVLIVWTFALAGAVPIPHAPAEQAGDTGAPAFGPEVLLAAALTLATPNSFFPCVALFLGMTPVAIAVVAAWDGLGSTSIVLRREYLPILVCALLSWSAAYLPLGLVQFATHVQGLPVVGHLGFLLLFAICLRTALGTSTLQAGVSTAAGWLTALGIVLLRPVVGHLSYFLLSPWILFLLYRYYSPDVRSLGESMNSRRSFRRQLEASMVNPRDADAHFQLGLIYMQRRQYENAVESFRRAVSIQPDEADAQLHLGRALRALGQPGEALAHIESALRSDPRVSRHEGWRELGATLLDLGRSQEALDPLERYTNAREYDPEGLFYYGLALRAAGKNAQARQAFEQSIAAVQTAPKYLRGQLRHWAGQSKSELKATKA
ncbi:MAG TPA: tetratricopeptide repeat protein [Bryobacteraceae bacterium]|nr:tetratricopeptide repeat protein [Bryobacteraceae bacterium]